MFEDIKIGVITVTYNSSDVLLDFFNSVNKQSYTNFNLYIIDNNSVDKTINKIQELKDERVSIIQNLDNVGVAAANNQGIEKAIHDNCDYILLLNNDTYFSKNTFENLIKDMENYNADIVVPKINYFEPKDHIWFAGGNFDPIFYADVNHYKFKEKDIGQFNKVIKITYAPTCCMLIKKEVFDSVGLMDEKYFVYEDDVDFCYRATILKNKKMICSPEYKFFHKVSSLTNKERLAYKSDFEITYSIRNRVYRCRKFFSYLTPLYLLKFILAENLRLFVRKRYPRTISSFILLNRSFINGMFLKK